MKPNPKTWFLKPAFFSPAFLILAGIGQYLLSLRELPWTLWPGLALYTAAVFLFSRLIRPTAGNPSFSDSPVQKREIILILLVLAAALFFRLYRLNEFPAGLFVDEGCEAWGALKILREGWRPFSELTHLLIWNPSIYYFLALWFKFFPATQISLWGASVFLGIIALPFSYWVFRRLAGPSTALTALFLLAVMRWHITYSRNAHPVIEILIYMSAALAFWLQGCRSQKPAFFLAGGLFCGLGFYSYQAYKPFLLAMAFYAVYEWRRSPARGKLIKPFIVFFTTTLGVSLPVWWAMIQNQSLGAREMECWAFSGVHAGDILPRVLHQAAGTALALSRQGDAWPLHNIPFHRLLDDGTGIMFWLGFGWALFHLREPRYFYPSIGFLVMSLPAFLSTYPSHASRLFGAVPFIALLAAEAFTSTVQAFLTSFSPKTSRGAQAGFVIFLGFCAVQNFQDYFLTQAKNPDCWRGGGSAEASWMGKSITRLGDGYNFMVCPRFFGNFTIRFLTYSQGGEIFPLSVPGSLDLKPFSRGKNLCLVLDEGHQGVLRLYQTLYPGGTIETLRDPEGSPIAYLYLLPKARIAGAPGPKALPLDYGLRGFFSAFENNSQVFTRIDPVLNFTFPTDFPPLPFPSLWARWTGNLSVPKSGNYSFLILATDQSSLELDGKMLLRNRGGESKMGFLGKGLHPIRAKFHTVEGMEAAFTLLWKKPGDKRYEVIPATAFRRGRGNQRAGP